MNDATPPPTDDELAALDDLLRAGVEDARVAPPASLRPAILRAVQPRRRSIVPLAALTAAAAALMFAIVHFTRDEPAAPPPQAALAPPPPAPTAEEVAREARWMAEDAVKARDFLVGRVPIFASLVREDP